jgi:hypothetical protein
MLKWTNDHHWKFTQDRRGWRPAQTPINRGLVLPEVAATGDLAVHENLLRKGLWEFAVFRSLAMAYGVTP